MFIKFQEIQSSSHRGLNFLEFRVRHCLLPKLNDKLSFRRRSRPVERVAIIQVTFDFSFKNVRA